MKILTFLTFIILSLFFSCKQNQNNKLKNKNTIQNNQQQIDTSQVNGKCYDYKIIEKNGKYGFANCKDSIIIPCIYDDIKKVLNDFKDGNEYLNYFGGGNSPLIAAFKKNGKWGIINKQNKIIVPFLYDDFYDFQYPEAEEPRFEYFSDGVALAKKNGKNVFINSDGKELGTYDSVFIPYYGDLFNENLAAVEKNGKWGFVDQKGNLKIPYIYEDLGRNDVDSEMYSFSEGFVAVKKNGKWGFIDTKGNVKINFKYDNLYSFSFEGDTIAAKLNGKWGFINKNDSIIIPFLYDNFKPQTKKLFPVFLGKWGVINGQKDTVVPFKYDDIQGYFGGFEGETEREYFIQGYCAVKLGDKWGLIDSLGNIKIPFEYNQIKYYEPEFLLAEYFHNGLLIVQKGNKYGIIDAENNVIIDFKYDDFKYFYEIKSLIVAYKNEKCGLLNMKGKELTPFKYDYIDETDNGFKAYLKDKTYIISPDGKETEVK